jgi:hypothetical protein
MSLIDIPTALTPEETVALTDLCRGRVVYEAGALLGYSSVAIAKCARQLTSVDPHDGYPQRAPRPTWHMFLHNLSRHGVAERVQAVRSTFQNALPPPGTQVAWADLTGEGPIMEQFLTMTTGVPVVALHDYGRGGCGAATAVIDRFIKQYQPRVSRVGTLIILEK